MANIPEGRRTDIKTVNVSKRAFSRNGSSAYKAKICQISASGASEGGPLQQWCNNERLTLWTTVT